MMPGQPGGDEVAAEPGPHGDDEPGDDLDGADGVHQRVCLGVEQVGELGRQVAVPVDEDVEELVQPEQDRSDDEPDPQEPERLVRRVLEGGRSDGRRTSRSPSVGWLS